MSFIYAKRYNRYKTQDDPIMVNITDIVMIGKNHDGMVAITIRGEGPVVVTDYYNVIAARIEAAIEQGSAT